ncbi:hypothetical protein LCGC14_2960440, partial [marine sediment metagenome]
EKLTKAELAVLMLLIGFALGAAASQILHMI